MVQGQKPILEIWRILGYSSGMEITGWTQEHFQKSSSVSTFHCTISNCRLKFYDAKKNVIQKQDHPACYQHSVQKLVSLMVQGCFSPCATCSLYTWKGTINVYTDFTRICLLQPDNMPIFITLHNFKFIYFINMNLKHTHTQTYTQKTLRHQAAPVWLSENKPVLWYGFWAWVYTSY